MWEKEGHSCKVLSPEQAITRKVPPSQEPFLINLEVPFSVSPLLDAFHWLLSWAVFRPPRDQSTTVKGRQKKNS